MRELKLKSATQQLKERFRVLREQLKRKGAVYQYWSERILDEFPEHSGTTHLYNVWFGRVADLEITELTAKVLEELENAA
jgi:hypothetical protein